MNCVYILVDPTEVSLTCYVGVTDNTQERLGGHIEEARYTKKKVHRLNWIRKLFKRGINPSMVVIETFYDDNERDEREMFWIAYYKSIGMRLCNGTDGGEGSTGRKQTKEAKQKVSKANKGRKFSLEARNNMSEAHIGKSSGMKGKTTSDYQKYIAHLTHSGKPKSKETKAKMSISAMGGNRARGEQSGAYNHSVSNDDVVGLFGAGFTRYAIAKKLGVSWSLVDKRLRKLGVLND